MMFSSLSPPAPARTRPSQSFCFESLESRALLADVPSGFVDTLITSSLNSPTAMTIAPDGRVFIAEEGGRIWVYDDGTRSEFLQIGSIKGDYERGLLGIALDPNFSSNGYVYVYYTRDDGDDAAHNRVSRYVASGNTTSGTETVLVDFPDINGAIFHMGGALHFGTDGKLYIAVGDHLQQDQAQSLNSVFGKILRFNSNGSIPNDNPFYGSTTGLNRAIWAYGLRNPFTFAVQPGAGRLFINDVGQDTNEEINDGAAGANYGWPNSEGPTNNAGETGPLYYYGHNVGQAITGGAFYNPSNESFPAAYVGRYFFADVTAGFIKLLNPSNASVSGFATDAGAPVDLDVGPDGALYYLGRGNGGSADGFVSRISYPNQGGEAPTISSQPEDQTVAVGASATFSVSATGSAPLSYRWLRDGVDIAGATDSSYSVASAALGDDGAWFSVRVSNDEGQVTSNSAGLTVVDDQPPKPVIQTPVVGTIFRAGQVISFSGRAADDEDGPLSATRFTWQIDYHTGDVTRPFINAFSGVRSGTFTIPTESPYTRTNVFYRILFTARDSQGQTVTRFRDIKPLAGKVYVKSNLPGATVQVDAQPFAAPHSFDGVVGLDRQISADAQQVINGVKYLFDHWSDGGDRVHSISTPDATTSYVARYVLAARRGLAADYYNNRDFTGALVARIDSQVNFDWGGGSPDEALGTTNYSARWSGKVQPPTTGRWTFTVKTDAGARLLVNNKVLISKISNHALHEFSGSINLSGGAKYNIKLEYNHIVGHALAQLRWTGPSTPDSVI
ncbi:MAG: PQQ-dependent sugar dehydrogenase, partial [Tepidisphaeraceae bacterium]